MRRWRVFVPSEPPPFPQERDLDIGWPGHLCGGPIYVDVPGFPAMLGAITLGDPELAFVEEALSWDDAMEDQILAKPEHSTLWLSMYEKARQAAKGSRRGVPAGPALRARQKGRPSGAAAGCPMDKTPYRDRAQLKAAALAHCRKELAVAWPFIGVAALERIVASACERSLLQPAPQLDWRPGLDASWDVCWLPPLRTFGELVEWAFIHALPTRISRREAVVRAVDYFFVREGVEWDANARMTSRPLAVASIAAGEEVQLRGPEPWFVAGVIESEQRAIAHAMKKLASGRLSGIAI